MVKTVKALLAQKEMVLKSASYSLTTRVVTYFSTRVMSKTGEANLEGLLSSANRRAV